MLNDERKRFLIHHSAFHVHHSEAACLSADTARPRSNAPRFCALHPAPQPIPQALPLSAPSLHTSLPAARGGMTVPTLLLSPGREPDHGGCAPALRFSLPAWPVPNPVGQSRTPPRTEILAWWRGRLPPLHVPTPPAPPDAIARSR